MNPQIAQRIAGIVFLVSLGVVAIRGEWWPGILVVLGVTHVVSGALQRERWKVSSGILWLVGLYLVFELGVSWLLLIPLTFVGIIIGARHDRRGGTEVPEWAQRLSAWGERMQQHADEQKAQKPEGEAETTPQ